LDKAAEEDSEIDRFILNYQEAIGEEANSPRVMLFKGTAFDLKGYSEMAIKYFKQTIKIKPDYAEAFNRLGVSQKKRGELDFAIESYKKAIEFKPNLIEASNNLGNIFKERGELRSAIKIYRKILEIEPDFIEIHYNTASAYWDIGDLEAALNSYQQVIKLDPDHKMAHWNQCLAYLTKGDFEKGWPKYEWRWKANEDLKGTYISTSKPIWNYGREQRVLLWAEQGIGDEVMFASIIPELYALCSKLIVTLDERLIPIFSRSFPSDIEYRPRRKPISESEYDAHIPIGSLLQYFRQTVESFKKSSQGWLSASEKIANSLRRKLLTDETETLIGISWHSTTPRLGAEAKVLTLNQIAKSLHAPKTKLINLQYGDVSEEIERLNNEHGIEVIQLPEIDNTNDLDGLASLIMACDKVVSISNFSIHLAGALGKEAHVLLAYSSDWRWGQKPNSNYWYDSVCLHRQTSVNDWNTALLSVRRYIQLDFRAA
jgi:Flp pilus assembly protein TadD